MNVAQLIRSSRSQPRSRVQVIARKAQLAFTYGFVSRPESRSSLTVVPEASFHIWMGCICCFIVATVFIGARLTLLPIGIGSYFIALPLLLAMLAPLIIYSHKRGWIALREAILVVTWELFVSMIVPPLVLIAARSHLPLQDNLLGRIDSALGVNIPSFALWAHRHWVGAFLDRCYMGGIQLIPVAALAPALTGQIKQARKFLLSCIISFAIGIPTFGLLPAVGPWYYFHTTPDPVQLACQHSLLLLRVPGPFVSQFDSSGIISFPSFHVIWAILSAAALWGFRPLRAPVALFSTLVVLSTMTTGWHYLTDVIAGIVVAFLSIAIAKVYA